MGQIANNLCELVGKTPLLRMTRVEPDLPAELYGKLESMNPVSKIALPWR